MVGYQAAVIVILNLTHTMKVSSFFGLSVLSLALALTGCKKTETDDLSRVKNYAGITLNGPVLTSINIGESFTDLGASATLNGKDNPVITVGRVDNTKLGFNYITYRSANTEGDTVEVNRVIAVVDPAVNNTDQSGNFVRNGNPVTITRVSKGLYLSDNLGGVPTTSAAYGPAYFAQLTPTSLEFPPQSVTGANGDVVFYPAPTNPWVFDANGQLRSFSYAIVSTGVNYGGAGSPRTFTRR
jgi:hypothetical protein